jgi:menaquinone-dependent protoporphyrinogen IX oxidase
MPKTTITLKNGVWTNTQVSRLALRLRECRQVAHVSPKRLEIPGDYDRATIATAIETEDFEHEVNN